MDNSINENIPFDYLSYDYFDNMPIDVIGKWFALNHNEIYPHVFARINRTYNTFTTCESSCGYFDDYSSVQDYELAINMANGSSKKRYRFIPAVLAVACAHQVSCQELLFGYDTDCVISNRLQLFLSLLCDANPLVRNTIRKTLKESIRPIYDIEYILSLRLMELADEMGISYEKFVWDPIIDTNSYIRNTISNFLAGQEFLWKPLLNGMKFDDRNSFKDYSLTIAIYVICTKYHISADRLLLRDYSQNACWPDGTKLTEPEKELASLFLLSDVDVQANVFNQLLIYNS